MTQPTPVTATCLRTGDVLEFTSMAHAEQEGFAQSCVSRAVRGISDHYAGYRWTTTATLRPLQRSQYRADIKRLAALGKKPLEIAAMLGCSHSTVHYNLRIKQ